MIFKDSDNHVSGDERPFEVSVTKNPYYPYNQEWFGHDEEDTLDLAKDLVHPICLACTMAKMLQCLPLVKFPLLYYYWHMQMMIFLKKKILHHFGHLILSFGTFGSLNWRIRQNPCS